MEIKFCDFSLLDLTVPVGIAVLCGLCFTSATGLMYHAGALSSKVGTTGVSHHEVMGLGTTTTAAKELG